MEKALENSKKFEADHAERRIGKIDIQPVISKEM